MSTGRYTATKQLVNGKWGTIYVTNDISTEELLNVHNITVNVEVLSTTANVIGKLWQGTKLSGLNGTGTLNLWYGSPFSMRTIEFFEQYKRTPNLEMTVYNNDPDSGTGDQILTIKNVQFLDFPMALLDADTGAMDQAINFVFEGYTMTKSFVDPDSTLIL